jgi:hypothetical protein
MTGCLAIVEQRRRYRGHTAACSCGGECRGCDQCECGAYAWRDRARTRQQQRRRESNERAVGRTVHFDYYDANGGRHTRFVGDGTVVEATQRRFLVDVIRSASNDLGPHDRIWIPKAGC